MNNSGKPGGRFSINIRGASSINAGNEPLYVIDGVPISFHRNIRGTGTGSISDSRISRSPLASLNPEDIKSIEVLKDASATAIYGSRGANGVVLITTKGGQNSSLQVDYNAYVGLQNVSNQLDLLNADQYEGVLNSIIDEGGGNKDSHVGDITKRTDWQNQIDNPNALVTNHQLSFSGGNEATTYYLSLNYMNQDGIIRNSGFKRYSARVNVNSKISDHFNTGLHLTTTYTNDNFASQGGGINEQAGAIYAAYNFDPTLPVRNADGNYTTSPFITVDNPIALAEGVNSNSNTNRVFGSVFGLYNFTNHLYAKLKVGGDYTNEKRKSFLTDVTKAGQRNNGIGTVQTNPQSNYLFEGTLHYENNFGIHAIKAFAGVTYQRFTTENTFQKAGNFPTDVLGSDNLSLGDQTTYRLNTSKTGHRLASYIGRANYIIKDRYLLTGTVRVDGSSRFGSDNRFAVFPSVALGWKLKKEKFLDQVDPVSTLKLRVSWGETGNQGIGNYAAISTFQQGQIAILDNNTVVTTTPSRLANSDLKWETTRQIDVGLDFGLFNERLNGSFDFYRKKTTNLLLNLPVPQSTGFSTQLRNIGQVNNSGFELALNSRNIQSKNFSWSSSVNFSTVHNEVRSLGPVDQINKGGGVFFTGNPAIIRPGLPLNSFYGYEIAGVWQQEDDFSATKENVKPGDLKFIDQNGDHQITSADRVVLGDSFPDLSVSLGNTFNFRNFQLYAFINAVQGVSAFNINKVESYYPVNFRRNKFAKPYLNRWTMDNPSDKYPSFVNPFRQGAKPVNSYTVEDASYIKLQTVRLSYTFPHFTNSIRSATVFVTGENLYTITNFDGIDPAANPQGNANYHVEFNTYPTARSFLVGIKLGL